ncbi:hypothetical protein NONI108955_41235 [Nocardia ninae]|uniref:Uncharacterized protein n=1 Tax=Nocardia ninae NBRC 108245 TaxID=1210091 RepID=A0A511MJU2_9NOCA|nr:hypothetical protein NN4_54130 [Nocardia ninae NBRC 108245]
MTYRNKKKRTTYGTSTTSSPHYDTASAAGATGAYDSDTSYSNSCDSSSTGSAGGCE